MGHELHRGSEFPRVYSPPEPPAGPRRFRLAGAVIVVVVLGLAAGAYFLLGPGGSAHKAARPSSRPSQSPPSQSPISQSPPTPTPSRNTPSASPTGTPSATNGPPPPATAAFTRVAAPCTLPDQATLASLVPGQQTVQRIQRTDDPTCIVTDADGTSSLVVETRLEAPGHVPDPVSAAHGVFAADLASARQGDGYDETLSVAAETGVGDEAFHWTKLDKGGPPAVVAQVEVRTRNGVIVITYSQNPHGGESDMAAGNRLVTDAVQVARQILNAYS